MKSCIAWFSLVCVATFHIGSAVANDLLVNGDFESPPEPLNFGWDLAEFVTGRPDLEVNSVELRSFANEPFPMNSELGLWLRAFAGNNLDYAGANLKINAIATQSVAATPGETYYLVGRSFFESNYSGRVSQLDPESPSGAIPSPTQSSFELAFHDASGAVIGSPVAFDLRDANSTSGVWQEHALMGVAPATAASVSVKASAIDMVYNIDPQQSAFYDNFSLTSASMPSEELLTNGAFDEPPVFPGWETTEPTGVNNVEFRTGAFANNTPGGNTGVWLRAFEEGDARVSQLLPAKEGFDYTLTAYSQWEPNYSGGQPGTGTETWLELVFLDSDGALIGVAETLDLRTVQSNDNVWRQHALTATAPPGADSARISLVATGLVNTTGLQSAFFDDFVLTAVPVPTLMMLTALVCVIDVLSRQGRWRR